MKKLNYEEFLLQANSEGLLSREEVEAVLSLGEEIEFYPLLETLKEMAEEAKPTLDAFRTGDSRDDIARYGLCLVIEAAELVNSLPWKRWARHPSDLEKSKEEFADLLCFIGSIVGLFNDLGISTKELAKAYSDKIEDNRKRFAAYRAQEDT